jgi:hypothetical protein
MPRQGLRRMATFHNRPEIEAARDHVVRSRVRIEHAAKLLETDIQLLSRSRETIQRSRQRLGHGDELLSKARPLVALISVRREALRRAPLQLWGRAATGLCLSARPNLRVAAGGRCQ